MNKKENFTYEQAYLFLKKELSHIDNIEQESRWMLEKILNQSWTSIISNYQCNLNVLQIDKLNHFILKRKNHYPLQYLLEDILFFDLSFKIFDNVLIPREETECLVKYILETAQFSNKILDIGTGTGVINITIKKYRNDLEIDAVDINEDAINCTLFNIQNILKDKYAINLYQSNLFQNISKKFDIIVSNPPYITRNEYEQSQPELKYEPYNSLVTENEGLLIYQKLADQAIHFLNPKGKIVIEISPLRKAKIIDIFTNNSFSLQEVLMDYDSQERALVFSS